MLCPISHLLLPERSCVPPSTQSALQVPEAAPSFKASTITAECVALSRHPFASYVEHAVCKIAFVLFLQSSDAQTCSLKKRRTVWELLAQREGRVLRLKSSSKRKQFSRKSVMVLFSSLEGKHCVSTLKMVFLKEWQETVWHYFFRLFESKLWAYFNG